MNNSTEILNEITSISPVIAGIGKVIVFQVPQGYFDELPSRITDYVVINNVSPVENINSRNLQQVPEGYFDSLSDSILAKVKLAYVESFEEELGKLSPTLFGLQNKNVFTVPEGYFESLSTSINNAVNTNAESTVEELQNISKILFDLKDKNVFTVPGGYFESFAENITEKLVQVPAKVITMKKRTSWIKYAAAAAVAGIITTTSLQIFKSNDVQYAGLLGYKASLQYKTEADLNAGIAKLDDADITKYLEKNGNVLDNDLLINNTDESELPNSTDYLNDENTLNEYLDKIDAQNVSKLTP